MIGSALAAVRESIDRLTAVDLHALGDGDIARVVLETCGLRERLACFEAEALARFQESGAWATDGSYSAANWLTTRTGTGRADASSRLRLGKLLRRMPRARDAFAAGDIAQAHVRLLGTCVTPRTRAAFERDEELLVRHAGTLGADDFAHVVRRWMELNDDDGAEPADEKDTFHMSRTLDGRLKGRFDLGAEAAAVVEAAINEKVQELFQRDTRNREIDPTDPYLDLPPANRRARGLTELIEQGAAAEDNPARRKPAFNVFIDPLTFAGGDAGLDAIRELEDRTLLPLRVTELLRCDCEAARVVLSAEGAVLDLGRTQRICSEQQRRALIARDRRCAVPGCCRPAHWTDAHHVHWWMRDGGRTDIGNLVLLCRHHHRRIHGGHLTVRMIDGVPKFWLADGRQLTPNGPAPSTGPPLAA